MLNRHWCVALTALATLMTVPLALVAQGAPADPSSFPFGCPVREGYVQVTGGKIWYEVVGNGNGVPLITVHGGPGFTHDYLEPISKLCKDWPVVFYDQTWRGQIGSSTRQVFMGSRSVREGTCHAA